MHMAQSLKFLGYIRNERLQDKAEVQPLPFTQVPDNLVVKCRVAAY